MIFYKRLSQLVSCVSFENYNSFLKSRSEVHIYIEERLSSDL
jgi:hypothetical protein